MDGLEAVYKKERKNILKRLSRYADLSLCEDAIHTGYINCMQREHCNLYKESYWALSKLLRYGKHLYDIDVEQVDNNSPENNLMIKEQTEQLSQMLAVAPNHVKARCMTDETYVALAERMRVSPITLRLKVVYHINKLRPLFDGFVQDKMITNYIDKTDNV